MCVYCLSMVTSDVLETSYPVDHNLLIWNKKLIRTDPVKPYCHTISSKSILCGCVDHKFLFCSGSRGKQSVDSQACKYKRF